MTYAAEHDLAALLAALPGTGGQELLLDWPMNGQVSLIWDTPPAGNGPLCGVDFQILHEDANTAAAIWALLAQAIPTARAHLAQTEQLTQLRAAARGVAQRLWARGLSLEEIADVLGGTAYDYSGLVAQTVQDALKGRELP
ncbi:hypothetical protein [Deinococcus soli (ex Cha et al. 2016)]|uniref:Uncharacterized protein n=2 Tax=Deinococcus soli (ex Cha et al. 2016) TaxID=1309411 RepID=A0AAE3XCU7_9DEIO|nr:hypothetical protein [Deinococcus soli (ex Cha et al. 2016)]MDR6218594.1 hypothetical protein [Deinococcus soli (ex Cha et al. 2016)]MDR6328391.1 hypothetical protein [Deinococcus soli (ex Cha et al. 2016)]MDR6753002.1 hypothetical protein [Deinococcus soli (ex Cha et al. 2016)]